MRRRLTTLRSKQGHSQNGAPRQMIDEAIYRERQSGVPFDSEYAGWSWATRPRDQAISLRTRVGSRGPSGASGPTGSTGVTPPPSQFVDLGTAGDFVIFSEAGITTTGGSDVNGDMGVAPIVIGPDPGTNITGFLLTTDGSGDFSTSLQVDAAPGFPLQLGRVFGPDYTGLTPAKVALALVDMQAAYTAASTTPAGTTVGGMDLGGSTLEAGAGPAGVYHYTGATTVGVGTPLTLHGTLPNDGIIIIIDGTFDVNADILLTGTLIPENVYFAVADAMTVLALGHTINGQFLGQTLIALQEGTTLNGRALASTQVTLAGPGGANNIVINEF